MFKNNEGYADPTAGLAMSRIMKEYRQQQKKGMQIRTAGRSNVASRYVGDVERNTMAAVTYWPPGDQRGLYAGGEPSSGIRRCFAILIRMSGNWGSPSALRSFGCAMRCGLFGEVSSGMAREIEEAKRLKKPLRYFEEVDA